MAAHMNERWKLTVFTAACLLVVPDVAGAQAKSDADRLITEALKPSPIEHNLRHLTDEIGGRVPGTLAMEQAVAWGMADFKEAGADRVYTETFKLPNSWAEGATVVTVSSIGTSTDPKLSSIPPVVFKARAVSVALGPPLMAQHIPVVDVGVGTPADFKKAGDISGKVILVHSDVLKKWADLFNEYLRPPAIIDAAVKGRAKAIAFIATREHDILYRHTDAMAGEIARLPMIIVAREDGERMGRLVTSGHPVWVDLSIPNKIGGPITAANVIAEIRGSEKPDEFVILGAHLDSWELGTGALDNGCNAALVIDALRTIKAAGLKPRRTIRFILFSGEEEGMMGSRAYAFTHRAELDRAAGVVIYDSGTGKTTGFALGWRKDVYGMAKELISPLAQFDVKNLKLDMEWGTDHFDFMLEGVPAFVADQQEANYLENYHAVSDTYDKVDFPQLKKNVAEAAALSFELANLYEKVGPRLTHDQIEQTMRDTNSVEMFKAFGLWDDWQSGKRGRQK